MKRLSRLITGAAELFERRPGLAAACGAILALTGQKVFETSFTDMKAVVLERATFPQNSARIELTRKLIQSVPCDERILAFQPLIAEAVADDLMIVHNQQSNALYRSDLFTSDRWNDVKLIKLPCEGEPE